MKVGNLVTALGMLWGHHQLGLVVEAEPDEHGTPGFWVLFFDDPDTWKWFANDERHEVKVISESR